jgi:hypothetical protein
MASAVSSWRRQAPGRTSCAEMERVRILSPLRICAATLCLAAGALMLALWPLSYYRQHELTVAYTPRRLLIFSSEYGRLGIARLGVRDGGPRVTLTSYPPRSGSWNLRKETTLGFFLAGGYGYRTAIPNGPAIDRWLSFEAVLPDWFVAVTMVGIGIALLKQCHRQFRLWMVFVVTTIFALALGLMVSWQ